MKRHALLFPLALLPAAVPSLAQERRSPTPVPADDAPAAEKDAATSRRRRSDE